MGNAPRYLIPVLLIVLYTSFFFAFRADTAEKVFNYRAVSGDGFDIVYFIDSNLKAGFKDKIYWSWGPLGFLLCEAALRLSGTPPGLNIWQFYQLIQFSFGIISLLFLYLILFKISRSSLISAFSMATFMAAATFITYTFDLHPDLIMMGLLIPGMYLSMLFFKEYNAHYRQRWGLFTSALLLFALGYFAKRTPIVLIPALVLSYIAVAVIKKKYKDIVRPRFFVSVIISLLFIVSVTLLIADYNKEYSFISYAQSALKGSESSIDYNSSTFKAFLSPLHLGPLVPLMILPFGLILIPPLKDKAFVRELRNPLYLPLFVMLFSLFCVIYVSAMRGEADIRYLFPMAPLQIAIAAGVLSAIRNNARKIVFYGLLAVMAFFLLWQIQSSVNKNLVMVDPALDSSSRAVVYCNEVVKRNPQRIFLIAGDQYVPVENLAPNVRPYRMRDLELLHLADPQYSQLDVIIINNSLSSYRSLIEHRKDTYHLRNVCLLREDSGYELAKIITTLKVPTLFDTPPPGLPESIEVYVKKELLDMFSDGKRYDKSSLLTSFNKDALSAGIQP